MRSYSILGYGFLGYCRNSPILTSAYLSFCLWIRIWRLDGLFNRKKKMSVFGRIVDELEDDIRVLAEENTMLGDLLLDAYLTGYNAGTADGRQGSTEYLNSEGDLEELVNQVGLDPKKVLRRLYCPQQTEENGECSCQE